MDEKKLLFKDSKVRLTAPKQGVQSKFIWFLELYISGSTNLTKVGFYRLQGLKQKFCLYWSIDCYSPDAGCQAIFYSGHKITVLIWPVCFRKGLSPLDA